MSRSRVSSSVAADLASDSNAKGRPQNSGNSVLGAGWGVCKVDVGHHILRARAARGARAHANCHARTPREARHAPAGGPCCTSTVYKIQNTECIMLTQTQLSFGNDHQFTKRITAALKTAQPHGRGRPHDKVRLGDRDEFKATQGAICWTSTAKAPRPQALVAGRPPPRRQAQNK